MQKTKKDLIESLLKNNKDGLIIIEISRILKISRNTVSIALAELKGADKIRIRLVGKAKLHYWQKGGKK